MSSYYSGPLIVFQAPRFSITQMDLMVDRITRECYSKPDLYSVEIFDMNYLALLEAKESSVKPTSKAYIQRWRETVFANTYEDDDTLYVRGFRLVLTHPDCISDWFFLGLKWGASRRLSVRSAIPINPNNKDIACLFHRIMNEEAFSSPLAYICDDLDMAVLNDTFDINYESAMECIRTLKGEVQ